MNEKNEFKWSEKEWQECSPKKAARKVVLLIKYLELPDLDFFKKIEAYRCIWESFQRTNKQSLFNEGRSDLTSEDRFYELKRFYVYQWFCICVNLQDKNYDFYFSIKTLNGQELNREKCVERIVFQNSNFSDFFGKPFKDNNDKLRIEVDKAGRLYLKFLSDWFLKRYDLPTAKILISHLKENGSHAQPVKTVKNFITFFKAIVGSFFPFWALILLFVFFILMPIVKWTQPLEINNAISNWNWFPFKETLEQFNVWLSNWEPRFFKPIMSEKIPAAFIYAHVFVLYLAILIFFVVGLIKNGFAYHKLLLPRMIGSIIIGYIPLAMTEEVWKWLLSFSIGQAATVASIATFACAIYLFIEVYNITHDKWISIKRALRVTFIGLLESLTIGLLMSDLFANTMILNLEVGKVPGITESIYPVYGFFGLYVPKTLLCYFPLALMIGIFLQIIWEDKPVTHPI